jgi:hypothetical protein
MPIFHKPARVVIETVSSHQADRRLAKFYEELLQLCIDRFPDVHFEYTDDLKKGEQ